MSGRLRAYVALGALALALGVLAGRFALVAFAAPLLLAAAALATERAPGRPAGRVRLTRGRAVEGDEVEVEIELEGLGARADVALPVTWGLRVDGPARAVGDGLHRFAVTCDRWGAHRIGPPIVRAAGPLGSAPAEHPIGGPLTLRVYPRPQRLRAVLAPPTTRATAGNRRSRERGDGLEFADLRPLAPGDDLRRVNWRASARRRRPYITERHPERNADVVLVLDSFLEARSSAGGTIDEAVRVAAAIAREQLRHRDRVGVVGVGRGVWWLQPGDGLRQLYRIVEALVEGDVRAGLAWHGVTVIDRRVLPVGALVVALSPLLDRRSLEALLELRARGRDVVVVEIDPEPYLAEPADDAARLARRVWAHLRERRRARLRERGIALVRWRAGMALDPLLEEVNGWRRVTFDRSAVR